MNLRQLTASVVVFLLAVTPTYGQDFSSVYDRALQDAKEIYENPNALARVRAYASLDFILKTGGLTDVNQELLKDFNVETGKSNILWEDVFGVVFTSDPAVSGVDWDARFEELRPRLEASYEQNMEGYTVFLNNVLEIEQFPVTSDFTGAIVAAVMTTSIVYSEVARERFAEDNSTFLSFIDCIFFPICLDNWF